MIEKSFGKNPLDCFLYYDASNRIDKVKRYHDCITDIEQGAAAIDDVTWSDLEMDNVFLRVNHTNCFLGEQVLYHKLHVLDKGTDDKQTKAFEKRLDCYEENPVLRSTIEERLQYVGKLDEGYYLSEYLLNTDLWKIGSNLIYHCLQIGLAALLILAIVFNNLIFLAAAIAVALINLTMYLAVKQKYEVFFTSLIEFKKVYSFAKWLVQYDKEGHVVNEEARKAVSSLGKMSFIITGMNGRRQSSLTGDILGMFREYMWGILLIDVSMFNYIMKIIADKREQVLVLLDFVGQVDSDIAVVSYRHSLDEWCKPEFDSDDIKAEGIAHPLIKNPVTNDFELFDIAILTGSNASGKSTFMKSIAINAILAQSINTCSAGSFKLKPVMVVTCMALRDDVITGESYYYREAKYLKRMLDMVAVDDRVLVVIDEILKGTNTKERIAASKAILEYIAGTGCFVLVATHDNELTENPKYRNYHFCNEIEGDDIVFDYKIHNGKNTQSNAIELLSHLGYPDEIVEQARKNTEDI